MGFRQTRLSSVGFAHESSVEHKTLFDEFLQDVVYIDQGRLDFLDTSITAIQKYLLEFNYGTRIRLFRRLCFESV